MKKLLLAFLILILGILFFNKTFLKSSLEVEGVKIKVPSYSYHIKSDIGSAKLISLLPFSDISNYISKYIENLPSCYDEGLFYDEDIDITFSKYSVVKKGFYNEIEINYDKGNLCEDEFVLESDWFSNFEANAVISEAYISKCEDGTCDSKAISDIEVTTIFNSIKDIDTIRIENTKNIGNNDIYEVSIYYKQEEKLYVMSIFKYNYYLAFKVIDENDHGKNALYFVKYDNILSDIYESEDNL
jgi:hypothetical protein